MKPNPQSLITVCQHCHREISTAQFALHSARCIPSDLAVTRDKSKRSENKSQKAETRSQPQRNWVAQETFACYLCNEQFPVGQLDSHMQQCSNREIKCQQCHQMVARPHLQQHRDQCDGMVEPPAWVPNEANSEIAGASSSSSQVSLDQQEEQFILGHEHGLLTRTVVVLPNLHPLPIMSLLQTSLFDNMVGELANGNITAASRRITYLNIVERMIRELAAEADIERRGGLTQAQFNGIPNKVYNFDGRNKIDCGICINELTPGQEVKALDCNHMFHIACLKEWLFMNKTCPMCRRIVFEIPQEERRRRNVFDGYSGTAQARPAPSADRHP